MKMHILCHNTVLMYTDIKKHAVTDPGFPSGEGVNPPGGA